MNRWVVLSAILAAGAGLRFLGLSWGLRHPPHADERYFVESVAEMLSAGDLDHRFYEYPGLFFYLLAPLLAAVPAEVRTASEGYLVARGLVAAFGVLGVALVYGVGARLAGRGVGLAAAALLAVSPVAVQTSHMVRADVVLAAFALAALLGFRRLGRPPSGDLVAGAALGAATAVKFTGLLLLPSYLAQRLLAPGGARAAARGALVAGVVCVAVFLALTPYALVKPADFAAGVESQLSYQWYERPGDRMGYLDRMGSYASAWPRALGVPGVVLAAAGLVLVRREWRTWLPLVLFPVTSLVAMALSHARFDRQMLPSLAVLALLAGVALARAWRWSPAAGAVLTSGALALPLMSSVDYVSQVSRPSTRDRVADWMESKLAPGARVLTTIEHLHVPDRHEALRIDRLEAATAALAFEADVMVTTQYDDEELLDRRGLPTLFYAAPGGPFEGPSITVRSNPGGAQARYRPLSLDGASFSASDNPGRLGAMRDPSSGTWWETETLQRPGQWLQIDLPRPTTIARLELGLGDKRRGAAKRLRLLVSEDGKRWDAVSTLEGRPPVSAQTPTAAASQVLVFRPVVARSLRLEQQARSTRRWRIAALQVYGPAPDPATAAEPADDGTVAVASRVLRAVLGP